MEGQPKLQWTLYLTIASLFIFISFIEIGPISSIMRRKVASFYLDEPSQKYVVMFDGGSTGTRLHVFTFVNSTNGHISLKDEYFEQIKPGLSNFAEEPKHAAHSVSNLLNKAKSLIPSINWDETPVALKATAGLRLLPQHSSDSILKEISEILKKSPFVYHENSVSVLDGEDEGIFAWFTLNFLLGKLNNPSKSVASLDLGGGSTQVTFLPVEFDTLVLSPKEYIMNTRIQNKTLSLYTHSYLGLGLMAARLSILQLPGSKELFKIDNSSIISTPCLPPSMKINWNWDQKIYTVIGSEDDKYGYKSCYDLAVQFLSDTVNQPAELWKREIYALSYYYDTAVDLGIIEGISGDRSTVGEFIQACKTVCSNKILPRWSLCLDCSYISALFQYGLGFCKSKEIMFVNQINGIETSWGLGAAFNMLL